MVEAEAGVFPAMSLEEQVVLELVEVAAVEPAVVEDQLEDPVLVARVR